MAVRAQALKVTQSDRSLSVHFGDRDGVMDLNTSIAERPQIRLRHRAHNASQNKCSCSSIKAALLPLALDRAFALAVYVAQASNGLRSMIPRRRFLGQRTVGVSTFGEDFVSGILNNVEAWLSPSSRRSRLAFAGGGL